MPFMGGITYLPFVRDSKLAPTIVEKPLGTAATTAGGGVGVTEKKSEEKKSEKPAVAPTSASAPASVDAVKAEPPAPTPTPATAVTAAAVVAEPLSPEAQAVADKIAATGEEIRKLKAAKVCLIYTYIVLFILHATLSFMCIISP